MALSSCTISLTTAMILVAMTAVLCTSMFAYYQTQNEPKPAEDNNNNAPKASSPMQRENPTRNIHLFWNEDEEAVEFVNNLRQKNDKAHGMLACIFHPSCGFSKQFNAPFAKLAEEIENMHSDVTVVKIFPKDMGLIGKLFDPINIRGYPTVIGDFTDETRVIDVYNPQSTSLPFRSVESMKEYIQTLKSKAAVAPTKAAPAPEPEPEPEPEPQADVDAQAEIPQPSGSLTQTKSSAKPQIKAKPEEKTVESVAGEPESVEEPPEIVEEAPEEKLTKKRRGRKPASHSD